MLKIEQNYVAGIPQTTVAGFAPRGLAWHWTAGATGRAGAEGTIRHFVNTRLTTNASYHILVWVEHTANHVGCLTVAMWIVPMGRASHSMNPGAAFKPKTGSALEAARFAEVHRILARDSDPNADSVSISYCGMPANLAADLKCATFRNDLRSLAKQLIAHPDFIIDKPHFGHGWIQPTTRYEMDQVGIDFFAMLYGSEATTPDTATPPPTGGTTVADIDTYILEQCTIDAGAAIRAAPADNAAVLFTTGATKATVITVGTKNGFHAYWVNTLKRWGYTKTSANILTRDPIDAMTAKEKAALKATGRAEGIKAAAAAAAATK